MPFIVELLRVVARTLPLLLGVTLISFLLMVWAGPDQTYTLLGKNPTAQEVAEVRESLGYDRPFLVRYGDYLAQLATLDLGRSNATGETVRAMLGRTLPVTLALMLPPFLLGHALALALGLAAAWRRGRWPDRVITGLSVTGMSISFVVIIVAFQWLLSSPHGLDLFPVRGWSMATFGDYLYHVTVPALCIGFVTLGYNTRFYRAVFADAMNEPHVLASRAFGAGPAALLTRDVLLPSLGPVIVQVLYSLPLIVIGGSLLVESYFGIPGTGKLTFDATVNGDQPVLQAVVGLSAVLFAFARLAADRLHRIADPRVAA